MPTPINPASVKETNDLLGQQSALWKEIAASTKIMAENLSKMAGGMKNTSSQIQEQQSYLSRVGQTNVKVTNDLATAQANAAQNTNIHNRSVRDLTDTYGMAQTALERFEAELEAKEAAFGYFEITDALRIAEETAKGTGRSISNSFANANAKVMSLVSGVGSLVSSLFDVAKAVIAIPFSFFDKVIEKGNKARRESGMGGGGGGGQKDNSFRDAIEEVTEKLGALTMGEGKIAMDMFKTLEKSQSNLAGTGRTLADVFGKNADALKAMAEVVEQLGPLTQVFKDEITDAADKLVIFQRGLGLSADDMKAFGGIAMASGKKITDVLEDASRMALTLGNKFGISAKLIAKDMAYMSANTGKFGMLSTKALGAVSTYIRKLGVEIKALEGVMGVFDDFESGTQAAAKLSSAFGVQIDSMKMMKAENPAEQIQMLRDAFAASGKSLDGLSRQQLKYLQDTTGLGEDAMKVLSGATGDVKLGDMEAAAADAASDTNSQLMTQSKILKDLAAGVKKLYSESSGGGAGASAKAWQKELTGFKDAFMTGMMKGIMGGKAFKEMTTAVTDGIYKLGDVSAEIGASLRTNLGFDTIYKGITKIFDPKNFEKSGAEVVKIFDNLFKDLKDPATADQAFHRFFDAFKLWFENMFRNPEAEASIMKAMEDLVGYMGNGISSATGFLMEKLTEVINSIVDFLSGNDATSMIDSATQDGIGGAFMKAFSQIKEKIVENWPALKDAMLRLIGLAFDALKPYLLKAMMIYFGYVIVTGFIGGMVSALGSALVLVAMEKFSQKMSMMMSRTMLPFFSKAGTQTGAAAAAGAGPPAGTPGVPQPPPGVDNAAGAAQTGAPTKSFLETFKETSVDDIKEAGKKIFAIARHVMPPLILFIAELAVIGFMVMQVGLGTMIAGLVTLGAAVLAIAGIAQVSDLLPDARKSKSIGKKLYNAAIIPVSAIPLIAAMGAMGAIINYFGGEKALVTGMLAVAGAVATVAFVAFAANLLKGDPKSAAMALVKSVPLLLAAELIAGLVGGLVFLLKQIGISPQDVSDMSKAMVYAVGAVALIALAGYALLAAAPDGGVTVGTALVVGGSVILGALAVFSMAFAAFAAVSPEKSETQKGVDTMVGLGKVIGMMVIVIAGALIAALAILNPFTLAGVIVGIGAIAGFLYKVAPMMADILKSIGDVEMNVGETLKKVEVLERVFALLDPVMTMVQFVLDSSGGWATPSVVQTANIAKQLESISTFFDDIMGSLSGAVTSIFLAANLLPDASEGQMQKAEIVGKLLDPIANLIGSMLSGIQAFSGSAEEKNWLGNTTKMGVTASEQLKAVSKFLLGDDKNGFFYAIIGTLPDIMAVINSMTSEMSAQQIESMTKKAEMVGKMVTAVGELSRVFGTIASATSSLGRNETKQKIDGMMSDTENSWITTDTSKIGEFLAKDGPFIKSLDMLLSVIPSVVSKFEEIKITGDVDAVKTKVESLGLVMDSMMTAVRKVLEFMPEGDEEGKMFAQLSTRADNSKTLIEKLAPVVKTVTDAFDGLTFSLSGEDLKSKITNVGSVMSTMMKALDQLTKQIGEISESKTGFFSTTVTANTASYEAKGASVKKVIEDMIGVISGIVKTFNDSIPNPTSTIGTVEDKITAIRRVSDAMMTGARSLLENFSDSEALLKNKASMDSMKETLGGFITSAATNLSTVLGAFQGVPTLELSNFESLNRGFRMISLVGDYTSNLEKATVGFKTLAESNLVTLITKSVEAIGLVDAELTKLEDIRLAGRIEKIGNALALKPGVLKIDNKPVNVNVQLNLTIDASDLAMEVTAMQTKLVSTSQITNNPFARVATTPTG